MDGTDVFEQGRDGRWRVGLYKLDSGLTGLSTASA